MRRTNLMLMIGWIALAMGAGCSHTTLFPRPIDSRYPTGFAFAGDTLVEYQPWEVLTTGGFLGLQAVGGGSIFEVIDSALRSPQLESASVPREEWNASGNRGWLFAGWGTWEHSILPGLMRTDEWFDPRYQYKSEASRRHAHVDLLEEATGTPGKTLLLVSIVPPVVARVHHRPDRPVLIVGSSTLYPWIAHEDDACVVTGLWALSRSPNAGHLDATRLIPEGTTMTLGEVREHGPSLWRTQLDAMREWVEPKPLER